MELHYETGNNLAYQIKDSVWRIFMKPEKKTVQSSNVTMTA